MKNLDLVIVSPSKGCVKSISVSMMVLCILFYELRDKLQHFNNHNFFFREIKPKTFADCIGQGKYDFMYFLKVIIFMVVYLLRWKLIWCKSFILRFV